MSDYLVFQSREELEPDTELEKENMEQGVDALKPKLVTQGALAKIIADHGNNYL